MEIKRDAYLEKLKIRKNNGMIKGYYRNSEMWKVISLICII